MEQSSGELEEEVTYTIAVMGGGAAGKSSLIHRFLTGKFEERDESDPTLLDEYSARFFHKGRTYLITFLDTAGQEQYSEHRKESILNSQGYLLVYDVTQRVSFEEVQAFVNEICRARMEDNRQLAIVIMGNKCDAEESLVQVSRSESRKLAIDLGCPVLEVSARSGQGVQEGLTKMLDEVTYYDRNGHSGTFMFASCKMILNMSIADRKKLLKQQAKMVWAKRTCILKGRELFIQSSRKGNVETTVPMEAALGIRLVEGPEARGRDQQGGVVLVMTPNMRYYFSPISHDPATGSSVSSVLMGWMYDLQRHASKAQMGSAIGAGERYDTLFTGELSENGESPTPERKKKKGSKLLGRMGGEERTNSLLDFNLRGRNTGSSDEKVNLNPLLDPTFKNRLANGPRPQRSPAASLASTSVRPVLEVRGKSSTESSKPSSSRAEKPPPSPRYSTALEHLRGVTSSWGKGEDEEVKRQRPATTAALLDHSPSKTSAVLHDASSKNATVNEGEGRSPLRKRSLSEHSLRLGMESSTDS